MLKRVCLSLLVFGFGVANAPQNRLILVGFPSLLEETDTRFDLLGGSTRPAWVSDTNSFADQGVRYQLWGLAGKLKTSGTGSERAAQAAPCQRHYSVNVQPALHRKGWLVASSAPWNLRPRPVVVVPLNNPAHLEAIRMHLESAGLSLPSVELLSATRADLDGDKLDEVILVAANSIRNSNLFPVPHGDQGTYGLMLVRKLVGGTVKTFVLGQDIFTQQDDQRLPLFFDLVNVLDLNGDGRLEIVMFQANTKGYKISALEWTGSGFVPRLTTSCGLP
ncbi:MAG: hypothetical protein SFU83_22120 [Meiothermus sp.]|nr:hypothetical protein [Meiothermus sp.]